MLFIAIGILLLILALFAFPRFSPVPYFPSNRRDLPLILKALNLRNDQAVIDLGAGDGIVIFKAADEAKKKRLKTSFLAVEINPVLVVILHIRRLFHSNKSSIKIVWADMFGFKTSSAPAVKNKTFFVYISPWLLEKLFRGIQKDARPFEVVSYFYPLPKTLKLKKRSEAKGVHWVYKYTYV